MPGHGLGLAVVKEIIHQHNGRLYIARSTTLDGLRLMVYLPNPSDEVFDS
jgi:signal transduction histidine kinase